MTRKPPYPICPLCGHPVVGAMMTSDSTTKYDRRTQEVERYYHPSGISVYCSNGDCNYDRLLTELPFPPPPDAETGMTCLICGEPVYKSERGLFCMNWHRAFPLPSKEPAGTVEAEHTKKVLLCVVCGLPQFETPSGLCCAEGHCGAHSKEETDE